jgi:hypothetical protein
MQIIPIALAASGMVVGREVRSSGDATGRVLCGKGMILTDSLIQRLRQLGIESLPVEGHPVRIEGEESIENMLRALDSRFRRVEDDAVMMKIKELYRRRIFKSMGVESGE